MSQGLSDHSTAFAEIAERSQHLVNEWLARSGLGHASSPTADPFNFASLFLQLTSQLITFPASVVGAQMSLWQDYFSLWQNTTGRMLGGDATSLRGAAELSSRPASDWRDAEILSFLKQSYLLTAGWLQRTWNESNQNSLATGQAIDFFARQFIDALTPMNFVASNPEVIRATIETGGENLIGGLKNLLSGLEPRGQEKGKFPAPADPFVIGETVASTPGKVVFRNELFELIQYAPSTDRVWRAPLLLIPPWTNRFYLFDLRETTSLVRWALDQQHTVFVISWAEPRDAGEQPTFDDYVLKGTAAAIEAIGRSSGGERVNAAGFGLGGTLLAATLAYLADCGQDWIGSATFLASLVDFSETGELGTLISDSTLSQLDDMRDHRDGVDVREIAHACTLQQETDLLWSFVVNNYLLGKDPFPSDLLRWNRDVLRLPSAAHAFYLREFHRRNKLVEPGGIRVAGRPLDLRRVRVPIYVLAGREDHIVPWRSAYKATRLLTGRSRFTLAASGHLAGIVNSPRANRYCYWTSPKATARHADQWRTEARVVDGSWWSDWDRWLRRVTEGEPVSARVPGSGGLPPICDAPGEYVLPN